MRLLRNRNSESAVLYIRRKWTHSTTGKSSIFDKSYPIAEENKDTKGLSGEQSLWFYDTKAARCI